MATYRRGATEHVADEQLVAMHKTVVGIVGTEDYGVASAVWKKLERGAPGIRFALGRNELLVQRHHREIADRIGLPLT